MADLAVPDRLDLRVTPASLSPSRHRPPPCRGPRRPPLPTIARISHDRTPTRAGHAGKPLRAAVAALVAIKLVVNTSFRFVYPFLPAIGRGLGIDLTQAGALVSVRWAAGVVTPSLLGLSGPVLRSRRLLVTGVLIFAMGSLLTAWTGVFVGAVAGFALLGLAKPMVDISGQTYVSARVSYRERARYLGVLELAWAGGLLVGAPFAGWLIESWTWRTPFWVLGSLGLAGLGAGLALIDSHDGVAPDRPGVSGAPGAQIIAFLLVVALIGFAHESVLVVMGGWLENSFGLTLLALGGVGTLLGVAELVGEGAMVSFTDRLGKKRSMALGMGLGGVGLIGLALVSARLGPSMAVMAVAMFGIEFGYISGIPIATEMRPRHRSRLLGWFFVATSAGRIVGDWVAPRVFTAGGMGPTVALGGLVILLALIVLWSAVGEVSPER